MKNENKELSKNELLEILQLKFVGMRFMKPEIRQAYQQIRKLIEGKPKVSREFVENLGHELYGLPRYDMVINRLTKRLKEEGIEIAECLHEKTVCINEEGNAGVFCANCGKQLKKEC